MPFAANAGTFTTLHTFTGGTDGIYPEGPLLYYSGALYGTTGAGYNNGNLFRVNARTGDFKVVHSFQGGTDGSEPRDGVIYQDGTLYGTTQFGGDGCNGGCGTIFSINLQTGAESVLYNFSQNPGFSALVYLAGTIYGSTYFGGANNRGSVFTFNPATKAFATIFSFGGAAGVNPNPQLLYKNGLFYGTTMYGGEGCKNLGGCGVVFSIDPTSGAESVIHAFYYNNGGRILYYTNLVYYAGSLLSDTEAGGIKACPDGCGVSYKVNATTGQETVLEDFANGGEKYSGMTVVDGNAYETLPSGGSGGYGELLEVNLKSGQKTVLYTFTGGSDGNSPQEPLTYHNGAFYGTTFFGGNDNCYQGCGTVFKFVP